MQIFLSFNNKEEEIQLPVLPSEIEIERGTDIEVLNTINIGEVCLIGNTSLARIKIESFFPYNFYGFEKYIGFLSPIEFVEKIRKWQESKRPIRIIITGKSVNLPVAIESFTYGYKDGTKDIYYTLGLIEYRFLRTKAFKTEIVTKQGASITPPVTKREIKDIKSQDYTVKKGDTLYKIAKRLTGNGANYKEIARVNNIDNPNFIKVGQVIKI